MKGYILIAEDDDDDEFLLQAAFRELDNDLELIFVHDGIELLDHLRGINDSGTGRLPALLVVDLNMPKKNGREAISEMSAEPWFRGFPTVVFSTTGNEQEKSRCRELGVCEFYVKPSNFGDLMSIVSSFREMAISAKPS